MDPITLDLVLTILASVTLLAAGAFAICMLPRTDREVAVLGRVFERALRINRPLSRREVRRIERRVAARCRAARRRAEEDAEDAEREKTTIAQ